MTLRLAIAVLALAGAVLPASLLQAQQQPRPAVQNRAPMPEAATPTEALFNAINLGDLDEVRLAVASGANTNARNILGLTPLDLAIDLGHTDIAFFLMSLGRAPTRPEPGPRETAPVRPVSPSPRAGAPPPLATAPAPAPTGVRQVAPLWRGGGGSAVPEAGFLGFDAGRPEGARPTAAQRPRG